MDDKHRYTHVCTFVFNSINALSKTTVAADKKYRYMKDLLTCATDIYTHINKQDTKIPHHKYLNLIFDLCLFGNINEKYDYHSLLCVKEHLRSKAFQLVLKIIQCNEQPSNMLNITLEYLYHHLDIAPNVDDEKEMQSGYELRQRFSKRRSFVGLKNFGSTCYLNSVLQQLFMVPSFANEILSINDKSDSLLYQLQILFLTLRESQHESYEPLKFVQTAKNNAGEQIDVDQQTDCQEGLSALFNQLNDDMKHDDNVIDDHFGFEFLHIMQGKDDCQHINIGSTQKTFHLDIEIKDVMNLTQALNKFSEKEFFSGDNKIMCKKCNQKVDAERFCTLKSAPKQLILCLKRFSFSMRTLTSEKINSFFEFEKTINIKNCMYFNHVSKDMLLDDEKHDDSDDDITNEDKYIYDLVGIIIHQGRVDSGHYWSYVRNRYSGDDHGQWFCFDDAKITKVTFDNIIKIAYGGVITTDFSSKKSKNNVWNKNSKIKHVHEAESERNAYVLFYEQRNANGNSRKCEIQPYLNDYFHILQQENIKIFRQETVLDKVFISFMKKLYFEESVNTDISVQTLIRFVFNVIVKKERNEKEIRNWWLELHKYMNVSMIETFVNKSECLSYMIHLFSCTSTLDVNRKCCFRFFVYLIKILSNQNIEKIEEILITFLETFKKVFKCWNIDLIPEETNKKRKKKSKSKKNVVKIDNLFGKEMCELIIMIININPKYFYPKVIHLFVKPLMQLIIKDQRYILLQNRPNAIRIIDSHTYLDIKSILGLFSLLIQSSDEFELKEYVMGEMLDNDEFICCLVKNQCFSVQYLYEIVKFMNIESIQVVSDDEGGCTTKGNQNISKIFMGDISKRVKWADFYQINGALHCFNAIYDTCENLFENGGLQRYMDEHLQNIQSNFVYYYLTKSCIAAFLELSKNNENVRKYIIKNHKSFVQWMEDWIAYNSSFERALKRKQKSVMEKNKKTKGKQNENRNNFQMVEFYEYRDIPFDVDINSASMKLQFEKQHTLGFSTDVLTVEEVIRIFYS